jgi:putative transposase
LSYGKYIFANYIQLVFAVSGRRSLIHSDYREEIQKYMSRIIRKRKQKMLAAFCMPDHTHVLVGMTPEISISDMVLDIKAGSSKLINDSYMLRRNFNWQEGFGAFSYCRRDLDRIIKYILNQEEHHRRKSFRQEYLAYLRELEVEYDERYLFKWIE